MSVEIVRADDAFALGTCGSVVLMVWRGEPLLERLRAASGLVRTHAAASGGKVAVVSVLEEDAPEPGPTEQKDLAREMRKLAPSMVATALVLEGGGERAQRKLEVGFVIDALRRHLPKQKYCYGTKEATSWVLLQSRGVVREAPTRGELLDAIELVRAAIGPLGG
ncbi:MAG: hypothetical protein M3Y87_35155 [Myxococcota bacterium]|nr:hypothetical protein [Myxococcota bacterium]